MPNEPHRFEPAEDKKSTDVYDNETGEYLGTLYLDEGKTTDEYRHSDGQYWFNNEGEFVPAAEEGDDEGNPGSDQGSENSDPKTNEQIDPDAPPPETPPPPGTPPGPPAGENEDDPDYAVGEDEPWEDDWDEDDWDNEDESDDEGDGDGGGADGGDGDEDDDLGDDDEGDGTGSGEDGDGTGGGGDDDGIGTGDEGDGIGAGGDESDRDGSKREKADEARQKADEAQDRATAGQRVADGIKALVRQAKAQIDDAKTAKDEGQQAGEDLDPAKFADRPGAGVDPPLIFSVDAADPVDLCSGAFQTSAIDFVIDTIGPALSIVRHSSSQLYGQGVFGKGQEAWIDASVRVLATGSVLVRYGDGRGGLFGSAAGGFEPPFGSEQRLASLPGGGFELSDPLGNRSRFNAAGKLTRVLDPHGNSLSLERNPAGYLARIVDGFGGALAIVCDAGRRIVSITDPANQIWRYAYDSDGRLITVHGPPTTANPSGLRARYGYRTVSADPRSRAQIERVENGAGEVVVQNRYGTSGAALNRVVEQIASGGRWQFSYARPAAAPTANPANRQAMAYQTVVTDPVGTRMTHSFNAYCAPLEQRLARTGRSTIIQRFTYDAEIRPEQLIPPQGGPIQYQWLTTANGLFRVEEVRRVNPAPGGGDIVTRMTYDAAGRMTSVTLPDGGMTDMAYDAAGRTTSVRGPAVTLPDGSSARPEQRFVYDARGRLSRAISVDGVETRYTYDAAARGLLVSQARTGRVIARWSYDALGRVAALTDAAGAIWTSSYDAAGQVIAETRPEGAASTYRYDAVGRMVGNAVLLNGAPVETRYAYDANGRCTSVTAPLEPGRVATDRFVYDAAGRVVAVEPSASARIECDYDERGLVTERRIAPGSTEAATERFVYDLAGNLIRWHDRRGQRWSFRYDGLDRLTGITRPDGVTEELESDALDRVVARRLVDSGGVVVRAERCSFDALGRVVAQEIALSGPAGTPPTWVGTTTVHDIAGRPVAIMDPVGGKTEMRWTADGDLGSIADALTNRTDFEWDAAGRLVELRDVPQAGANAGVVTRFTVDMAGRVRTIADRLGNRETIGYDSLSQVTALTRGDGITETRTIDLAGRLLSRAIPWPGAGQARFDYGHDDAGRLTALTDPDGQTTHLDRSPTGRIARVTGPSGTVAMQFLHEADGSISRTTDARGVVTNLSRDRLGQLTARKVTKPGSVGGTIQEQFAYDVEGRLVAASNDDHNYSAAYDSIGRLVSETNDGQTTRYHYGADLLPSRIECPGGTELHYTRDALGRVATVGLVPPGAAAPTTIALGWVGSNRLATIDHGNGLRTEYSYDRAGRLVRSRVMRGSQSREQLTLLRDGGSRVGVAHQAGRSLRTFDRDGMGQVTAVRRGPAGSAPAIAPWLAGGSGTQATLNSRIASSGAAATQLQERYTLTPGGDRISAGGQGGTTAYVTGPGHRYQQAGQTTLAYDTAGNVTDDGTRRYTYDYANRLVRVDDASGARLLSLTYDPLGRIKTIIDAAGARTIRHYLGLDLVEEIGAVSTRSHAIAFGLDQALAIADAGGIAHLHRDQVWSVTAISNAAGTITERYDYSLFGELDGARNASGAALTTTPRCPAFQGRPALLPGLIDVRQRVLHTGLGRFLQCDPAGLEADANPYRFGFNDPSLFVDPTGELLFVPILVGAAVGAGISAWANRDKSGADFWVAVGAGAVGGAIAGTGAGMGAFIAGGAASGVITGAYEGGKAGGVKGAVVGAVVNGAVGAAAGAVGGAVGARISTGVAGSINASLTRGALRPLEKAITGPLAYQGATYVGTAAGGAAGGFTGGFAGGVLQGSGTALVNGADAADVALGGLATGIDGAIAGVGPGIVGGVASKAGMQIGFGKNNGAWEWGGLKKVFGAEGEFFAQGQSGNMKSSLKLPGGAEPDLFGDNLPWAKQVYGDAKNTAKVPNWDDQPSVASGIGQLRQIYDAIPNRFNQTTNPTGNKMTLYIRPGVSRPGKQHGLWPEIDNKSLQIETLKQFVFAPPDTAGSIK